MIAGLLAIDDSKTVSQVPGLGSLPVVGRFFRSPITESTQQELVITVTPELVEEAGDAPRSAAAAQQEPVVVETSSRRDPVTQYALQVQDRIARSIRYPELETPRGLNSQATLRLHLRRDGALQDVLMSRPSGVDAFDREVLQAAKNLSPYPAFPSELAQQDLWLELPIVFQP